METGSTLPRHYQPYAPARSLGWLRSNAHLGVLHWRGWGAHPLLETRGRQHPQPQSSC